MPRPFAPVPELPLGEQHGQSFPRLVELMQRLLAPDGCPWDREQTFETLRKYVVEEAHEVVDAIDSGDRTLMREELGDLLLQVVFQAELGRKEGAFGPDDVVRGIIEKLVRRHPHVFAETQVTGADEVQQNWEQIKANEKAGRGLLDSVPRSMPALLRAQRVGEKVERVGFDWPDTQGSRAKVDEEIGELDEAIASGNTEHVAEELGDVLFALVNLARHIGIDAEAALRATTDKFTARFSHVERRVSERHGGWPTSQDGEAGRGVSLEEMDGYWQEAKRLARGEEALPIMPPSRPLHPVARTPEEWAQALAARGERAFRAAQVFRWVQGRGVLDPALMTDLPASLRQALSDEGLGPTVATAEVHESTDGTRKLLVRMGDGVAVESVLIPGVTGPGALGQTDQTGGTWSPEIDADAAAAADDEGDGGDGGDGDGGNGLIDAVPAIRVSQCISTQVGCAMGCVFCASGVAGLKRHLGPEEIVGQVLLGKSLLRPGEQLRNVVLMGMGEPLHNYEATARALKLLIHPQGIALSSRRVTVSTSGLVPEIARLGADFNGQIGLAISLHATDDETRSRLMPINKKYPLAVLMQALRDYPLPKRRRITIEYTLVSGRNDSVDEARKLCRLLKGLRVKINLIPMNPIEASTLGPPDRGRVLAFQQVLIDDGYSCFIRKRRGDDVAAACGQLALQGEKRRVRVLRD